MLEMALRIIVLLIFFCGLVTLQKPNSRSDLQRKSHSDMETEIETLKALLKETRKANKRLKKQNQRQKQVWFALEQMCKALGQTPLETRYNDTHPDVTQIPTTVLPERDNTLFRIQPLSVTSKVLNPSGNTTLTVEYTSERQPTMEWLFWMYSESMYRTGGWTKYRAENNTYISGITLTEDLLKSHVLFFRVYDMRDVLILKVNLTAVLESRHQNIPPMQLSLENPENPIYASRDNRLNTSFLANGNVSEYRNVEAFFSGLNMSAEPPEMFETTYNNISVSVKTINASQMKVDLDISNQYSTHGGALSLIFISNPDSPGLYTELQFGRVFYVLSNETQTVVHPNTVGLYPLPTRIVLYPPYQSVMCAAMGDPRPGIITLEKHSAVKGVKQLHEDMSVILDDYTHMSAYTLNANDASVEGKYTCRASNGNSSASQTVEVVAYREPVVDRIASGLKTNSSNKMEVACQASGMPVPHLELRIETYGVDLAKNERYSDKVVRSNPNATTALLQMTISPVDTDIKRLYCTADNSHRFPIDYFPVELFPEVKR